VRYNIGYYRGPKCAIVSDIIRDDQVRYSIGYYRGPKYAIVSDIIGDNLGPLYYLPFLKKLALKLLAISILSSSSLYKLVPSSHFQIQSFKSANSPSKP
jgi:hypothetical protein